MPFPALALRSPPPTTMSSNQTNAKLPRPRGLWKAARETPRPHLDTVAAKRPSPHNGHSSLSSSDDENIVVTDGTCCGLQSPLKKRKISAELVAPAVQDETIFWDYSRKCNPQPERLSKWITRTKIMDTSSVASAGLGKYDRSTCGLEDWQDLKELFSKAVETYENEEPEEAIPILRGVIHECHRFMRVYPDPSVVYASPALPDKSSSEDSIPPEERLIRELLIDGPVLYPPGSSYFPLKKDQGQQTGGASTKADQEKKCKCKDLPTSFYTIFGTTLFLFGNLMAQDHSLALQGEPSTPTPYWLSALDVFQIGENLPIRLSGRGCANAPEDWRMAIVWGRTLVNLADEILTRQKALNPAVALGPANLDFRYPGMNTFSSVFAPPSNVMDEPIWPPESPFALIVVRRPPSSYRLSLTDSTPHELLQLAQDQFYRGIFHMPHQRGTRIHRAITSPVGSDPMSTGGPPFDMVYLSSSTAGQPLSSTFSRTKELYTIGSEVLLLAEKLDDPSERYQWAHWADGIFGQMKMESVTSEPSWRTLVTTGRGRCHLVMGAARAEEMDSALENEDLGVLDTEEADEAREALRNSITFLEKAREMMMDLEGGSGGETLNEGQSSGVTKPTNPSSSSSSKAQSSSIVPPPTEEAEGSYDDDEVVGEIQAIIDDGSSVIMTSDDVGDEESHELAELRTLLAEALLTLANLTRDREEREALYARADKEGRGAFELDEVDDRMDES